VAYYRRIVTVMRAVPGASKLRFDWCFSLGQQYLKPDSVYPGDAYVDYIGADVYNQSWNYPASDAKDRWNQFVTEPYGLQWQAAFAQQHGKPISFPEWATGTRPDGHGGGDDPYFVQQMSAWIASHNVYYHSYWDYDAPDFAGALSTGEQPQSAAQFLAIYH
jgi:beta-mannanase